LEPRATAGRRHESCFTYRMAEVARAWTFHRNLRGK
jgi:hypothetical protein